ncbi:MAG: hypothetical protein JW395_0017 [Nitrospira sp.]|nr:hypothetical protein [Nitrospira sp.]
MNERKKSGVLHHLLVTVELAQSAPYNPPSAYRSVILPERARVMPFHLTVFLGQRHPIFYNIKRFWG